MVSVAGLAATLQAAVVNAIATIVRNTVVILGVLRTFLYQLARPTEMLKKNLFSLNLACPKTVNKSNPVWTCPT